ncbi:MAG: hypothetical protein IPJ07_00215 [Acidobacteria bacterium]|nr:hypothetical protein [Acidobacteriota bacterium]
MASGEQVAGSPLTDQIRRQRRDAGTSCKWLATALGAGLNDLSDPDQAGWEPISRRRVRRSLSMPGAEASSASHGFGGGDRARWKMRSGPDDPLFKWRRPRMAHH